MSGRTVTVAEGRLRWGYHLAGTVRGGTVTCTDGAWSLVGTVAETDAYRLAQRPLSFVVMVKSGAWTWPIEALQIANGTLTARLGSPET